MNDEEPRQTVERLDEPGPEQEIYAGRPGAFERGGGLRNSAAASQGLGFGAALAIVISYTEHKSIAWAIVHGLLSWFYVIYASLFY